MTPRTPRPARADVRAGVLEAAREVFAEVGYRRATLDLIAARAGFTKGAVYSNFAGKDDLILELLGVELEGMADAVTGAVVSGPVDPGTLAKGLYALTQDGRAQIVFAEFRAAAAHDPALAARLATVRTGLIDTLADRFSRLAAASSVRLLVPARDVAVLVLALSNGLALEQVGQHDPVIAVETLTHVLLGLIAPAT